MKINKKKFGKSLKDWRGTLTQQELASWLKLSQGSICSIEKGHSLPSAETITIFYALTDFRILSALKKARE